MGLFNWIQTQVTGVDVAQVQSDLNAEDAKLAQLNQQKVDSGQWNSSQYQTAQQHLVENTIDAQSEVDTAFVEGAKEGLANEQAFVKSSINNITSGILGFIPWWVYPVAGVVLFFYLGGGVFIKGYLSRKK
jgi:hypothetical protein